MIPELGRLADGSPLMIRARRLTDWVGQGKPVTPKGVPRPADVPDLAGALEVQVPARLRTATDVEAVHWPWLAAREVGWLIVTGSRAVAAGADRDASELRWWAAVKAVLNAESHDDRGRGAPVLCRILLTALASGRALDELSHAVHELLDQSDIGDTSAVYSAFRRGVMPEEAGLKLLADVGALGGDGKVTELGRWMLQRLVEEWPPPISGDASAAELLDRLAGLPDDETWRQAGPWLIRRNPVDAADELLAAAAAGEPVQRVVAIDVAAGLGERARPAWHRAADVPILAPHVRAVLAELRDDEDDEAADPPHDADQRWFAVEYALAALASEGLREAYFVFAEREGFTMPVDSGHPGEATLRSALAELAASGGPPVPTYQLKITLTRVRPPVWRRLHLPATATLGDLHQIVQVAFDWDDDHLHLFTANGRRYSDPFVNLDDCADEFRARLCNLASREGAVLTYVYDLGDEWEHRIVLERIIDSDDSLTTAICIGGKGDAPVEDWTPESDRRPARFDIADINRRLSRTQRKD